MKAGNYRPVSEFPGADGPIVAALSFNDGPIVAHFEFR